MEFPDFVFMTTSQLHVEPSDAYDQSTRLVEDLGLDSFMLLDLIVLIETEAALDRPPIEIPVIVTLGDAYDYYRSSLVAASL
jgi:acyl carrier protein